MDDIITMKSLICIVEISNESEYFLGYIYVEPKTIIYEILPGV